MKKRIRNYIRKLTAAAGVCMMALIFMAVGKSADAYGADSSVIESVSVTLSAAFGEAEEVPEPEITVSGSNCSLGSVEYQTEYEKWRPGSKVRINITIEAAGGKIFPASLTSSQCKVKGADFVSARASGNDKLVVKVDYRPITVLGNTSRAGWSSTVKNRAVWNPVDYAPGYTVTLYGDNKTVKKLTVTTPYADLDSFIKDDGREYFYEVKAVPVTSDDKKYFKEGILITSSENDFLQEDTSSNSAPGAGGVGTWKKELDQWYYYDNNRNRLTGWQNIGGVWYYLNQSGAMMTGWINPTGDARYFLDDSGAMLTGWIQPEPGAWYYMNGSGAMQKGWVSVNGKWYYMAADGRMQTGWVQVNGLWYYLYPDGSMAANAVIEGRTLGPDGAAQ